VLSAQPEHDDAESAVETAPAAQPHLVVLAGGKDAGRQVRRGQIVLALLILPLAVGLTVVAITLPPDHPPAPRLPAASSTPGVVAASRATGPGSLRIATVGASAQDLADLEQTGVLVLANGEPDSGRHPSVRVLYYDQARREAAREVQRLLGRGTLSFEPAAVAPASDITIIYSTYGKDSSRT
jgi:hypothetical protein